MLCFAGGNDQLNIVVNLHAYSATQPIPALLPKVANDPSKLCLPCILEEKTIQFHFEMGLTPLQPLSNLF